MKDIQVYEQQLTGATRALYAKSEHMSDVKDVDNLQAQIKEVEKKTAEVQKKVVEQVTKPQEDEVPKYILEAKAAWAAKKTGTEDSATLQRIDWCIKKGITPEEYYKDLQEQQFYQKFLVSRESLKVSEKEFDTLIKQWQKILSEADYLAQKKYLMQQAAEGVGPEKFIKNSKDQWDTHFKKTTLKEVLDKGLIGKAVLAVFEAEFNEPETTIEQFNKAVVESNRVTEEEALMPVLLAEQITDPEELKVKQQEWAKKAWEYHNKMTAQAERRTVGSDELSTQAYLIEKGIGPDAKDGKPMQADVVAVSQLNNDQRIQLAELVLKRSLDQDQRENLIAAHEVGITRDATGKIIDRAEGLLPGTDVGVYNYTQAQLAEKTQLLKSAGVDDKDERRMLIETGIAGSKNDNYGLISPHEIPETKQRVIEASTKIGAMSEEGRAKFLADATQLRKQNEFTEDQLKSFNESVSKQQVAEINSALTAGTSLEEVQKALRKLEKAASNSLLTPEDMKALQIEIGKKENEFATAEAQSGTQDFDRQSKAKREQAIKQIEQMYGLNRNTDMALIESLMTDEKVSHQERITRLRNGILEGGKLEGDPLKAGQDSLAWLQRYVGNLIESIDEDALTVNPHMEARLRAIAKIDVDKIDKIEEIKSIVQELTDTDKLNIRKYFFELPTGQQDNKSRYTIQSLDELVDHILEQGGDFRTGGKYEIRDARGEIHAENLIAWMRERLNFLRSNSPDSAINVFSDIQIKTSFRVINLNELVYVPGYFNKRKLIVKGTEEKAKVETQNVEDKNNENLKLDMVMEAWLFGGSHSKDANYRAQKGVEKELENMGKFFSDELFTKNQDRMLRILRMKRSGSNNHLTAAEKEAFKDTEKDQGAVGKSVHKQILAFYHLAELAVDPNPDDEKSKGKYEKAFPKGDNKFREIMGKEGMDVFFQSIASQIISSGVGFEDEMKSTIAEIQSRIKKGDLDKKLDTEQDTTRQILNMKEGRDVLWGKIETRAKNFGFTKEDFDLFEGNGINGAEALAKKLMKNIYKMDYGQLNIFADKKEEIRNIQLVSSAVNEAASAPFKLNKNDREYAGNWGFSFAYWTGIGARNDTSAQGFDAWSKLMNFQDYRMRGARERGGAGNTHNMAGIKRLSFTMWDGLHVRMGPEAEVKNKDEREGFNTRLIDALEGGLEENKKLETFDFKGGAGAEFAEIHVKNALKLFQFLMDEQEMKLGDFVKTDQYGNIVFDHAKAQSLMGGPAKYIRYAFDQPGYLWGSNMRDYVTEEKRNKDGTLNRQIKFQDMNLRQYMFGEEINHLQGELYKRPKHAKKKDDEVARSVFGYLVAKEIKAHRTGNGNYPQWSIQTIQQIEAFFRQWSADVTKVPGKGANGIEEDYIVNEPYFDEKEWGSLLKLINSSYTQMYNKQLGLDLLAGTTKGLIGMVGGIFKDLDLFS
jgi:hypothetical protein